jgi:hypothetical protein
VTHLDDREAFWMVLKDLVLCPGSKLNANRAHLCLSKSKQFSKKIIGQTGFTVKQFAGFFRNFGYKTFRELPWTKPKVFRFMEIEFSNQI